MGLMLGLKDRITAELRSVVLPNGRMIAWKEGVGLM
jgi:hypothetical protein